MLFNEPKLLKFSSLGLANRALDVSVLFNEPKLLKWGRGRQRALFSSVVSVLFNEPKLLKSLQSLVAQILALVFQCSSTSRNC